ncbi:MAG: hypothetical protein PUK70_01855 [Bacteroidales bacterium]|nr:hypothetical protein [Bacteroidales bacterium]
MATIMTINQLVTKMIQEKVIDERVPWHWSWGDRQKCAAFFIDIFTNVDGTIIEYRHLPEYEGVIDWMTDTDDNGLLLSGDGGRGKSIILNYVLPVLFRMKGKGFRSVSAQDLYKTHPYQQNCGYYQRPETYLDLLERSPFQAIDELGVEGMYNDYGEKCEGINLILNAAERYHRPVFITTNLTEQQILNRYGDRTFDPCRTVKFNGESLR